MHFHFMTDMATPWQNDPCPGGHGIYNFNRPFLGHHYCALSLSEPCPKEEKKIFEEIHQFYTFFLNPKLPPPPFG